MLPQYYNHAALSTHGTLLNWHVALLDFQPSPRRRLGAVILVNALPPGLRMSRVFDLKGSSRNRSASDKDKAKECPLLKDNDLRAMTSPLQLHPKACGYVWSECVLCTAQGGGGGFVRGQVRGENVVFQFGVLSLEYSLNFWSQSKKNKKKRKTSFFSSVS